MPTARRRQRSQILALLNQYEPILARAFRDSVDTILSDFDMAALEAALRAGNTEAAMRALRIDRAAFLRLETGIQAAYSASGTATAGSVSNIRAPDGRRLFVRFDLRNPRAEAWVRDHSSTLVTNIITDQRTAIRTVLDAGLARGDNPRRTALDIVGRINRATGRREGGIVGLTGQQSGYVDSVRRILSDPDQIRHYFIKNDKTGKWEPRYKLTDRRFDRTIVTAINDKRALDRATVDRISGRYADSLLRYRGETIGRTESMTALHAAQDEAFRQAIDAGEVRRQDVRKIWRATNDFRTRDSHRFMDGETVGIDDPFPNGLMYPGDQTGDAAEVANCRCWQEVRIDFLSNAL